MIRTALLTSALALALVSTGQAGLGGTGQPETVKRDIYGFETGMTLEQAQAVAAARDCQLQGQSIGEPITKKTSTTTYSYLCKKTEQVYLWVGPHSNKILDLTTIFRSELPPKRVVADMCKQFTSHCPSARFRRPIPLGDELYLTIGVRRDLSDRNTPAKTYEVGLHNRSLHAEERKLEPAPAPLPKL